MCESIGIDNEHGVLVTLTRAEDRTVRIRIKNADCEYEAGYAYRDLTGNPPIISIDGPTPISTMALILKAIDLFGEL